MKFSAALVLAVAGSVLAKGNSTKALSTKAQCNEVKQLTQLVNLAANQTRLDAKTKGNATKAEAIQAKASTAATTLSDLQSNTTLMDTCNQIFAVQDMEDACDEMASLEHLTALAANQTALDAKTDNNATKADAVKAKASANAEKLSALQSNTTLTQFCSVQDTKATCAAMKDLQKSVDLAGNSTLLDDKFDGNATKIANFQAKASKAATKLQAMTSNSTLVDACGSLKSTSGGTEVAAAAAAAAASSSSASSSTSSADGLRPQTVGATLFGLFIAGVCMM